VEIGIPVAGNANLPALLARIENFAVQVRRKAKVVVNERTGTVVMGQDVGWARYRFCTAASRLR